MFVVDTHVLVYAANRNCSEHERCLGLLEEWRNSSLPSYITWPIVYQFLRVTTHRKVLTQPWSVPEAWSFIDRLAMSKGLGFLVESERHLKVAAGIFAEFPDLRGNLLYHAHTVVLMREHGIRRIYTRETDYHRFPFLEIIDPLQN